MKFDYGNTVKYRRQYIEDQGYDDPDIVVRMSLIRGVVIQVNYSEVNVGWLNSDGEVEYQWVKPDNIELF